MKFLDKIVLLFILFSYTYQAQAYIAVPINLCCEGVVNDGAINAIRFRMASQNNDHWWDGEKAKSAANHSTSKGLLEFYHKSIPNVSFAEVTFETPIPTIWWHSVYASTNGFAFESFMDELD